MRVAFDVTALLAGRTGVARYVDELGRALDASGVRLDRFAIGRSVVDEPWPPGLAVRRVRVPLRVVHRAWALAGWPRAERLAPKASVVHSTDLVPPPTRRPLVVTVHDLEAATNPSAHPPRAVALQRAQLDAARDRADAVLVTTAVTAELLAAAGVDRARIVVTPLGRTPLPEPDSSRVPDGRFLLAVGAVSTRKGVDTLVRALALLPAGASDVRLVLAGPDGWEVDRVDAAVDTAGVGVRVLRLGPVDDATLAALYERCSALCLASVGEGFGMPVLEGLAAGVPVLASDLPVLHEVGGEDVTYVPAGDVEQWAAAIEQVLTAGPRPAGAVAAAAARARGYTWARTAALTAAAYERVLAA